VVGAIITPLVTMALLELTPSGLLHAAGLAGLLCLLPTVTLAQVPLLRDFDVPKMQVYASSAGTLVLLGGSAALLSRAQGGPGWAFAVLPFGAMVGWTALILALGVAITLAFKHLSMHLGIPDAPILRLLLPTTTRERWVFAGLSVCAGFGEEMAYRGYLIPMLTPLLGGFAAVAVSSIAFGLLHAYQGAIGIVRTTVVGMVMAGGFLLSGSLWPPVLAHLIFDVVAGIFLSDALMVPEQDVGVSHGAADSGRV
jgi:membrane protease YdiL (CAAX protease family)